MSIANSEHPEEPEIESASTERAANERTETSDREDNEYPDREDNENNEMAGEDQLQQELQRQQMTGGGQQQPFRVRRPGQGEIEKIPKYHHIEKAEKRNISTWKHRSNSCRASKPFGIQDLAPHSTAKEREKYSHVQMGLQPTVALNDSRLDL